MSAYLLDWVVCVTTALALLLLSGTLLLLASDLDRHDPPDWSLYVSVLVLSSWPPAWYLYTALSWALGGATLGMRCMGLNVVDRAGQLPGVARSALRAAVLALLSAPLLFSPLLVAAAVALRLSGPPYVSVPVTLLVLGSAAACASGVWSSDGRAVHDRLSGTWVVRASLAEDSPRAGERAEDR